VAFFVWQTRIEITIYFMDIDFMQQREEIISLIENSEEYKKDVEKYRNAKQRIKIANNNMSREKTNGGAGPRYDQARNDKRNAEEKIISCCLDIEEFEDYKKDYAQKSSKELDNKNPKDIVSKNTRMKDIASENTRIENTRMAKRFSIEIQFLNN
jgi:hypothetical protein